MTDDIALLGYENSELARQSPKRGVLTSSITTAWDCMMV